jgi:hypothetical protein
MSSWWLATETGAGEAAVKDVVAVLELTYAASDGSDHPAPSKRWSLFAHPPYLSAVPPEL